MKKISAEEQYGIIATQKKADIYQGMPHLEEVVFHDDDNLVDFGYVFFKENIVFHIDQWNPPKTALVAHHFAMLPEEAERVANDLLEWVRSVTGEKL
jgi:hypothetical protein